MHSPAISVILPIYNVAPFLEQCLKSLKSQVFQDYEVIMVNDGSTDNGPQIASAFAQSDARFKLYHKQNGGLGYARNTGMQYASGEYIKYVDSDDWCDKGMLDAYYYRAKRFDADLVIGTYIESAKNDTVLTPIALPQSLSTSIGAFHWKENLDVFATPTPVWDKLYRRSMLIENNISFIKENCEDIPYRWQTLIAAKKISVLSTPYYYYRVREGSLTGTKNLGADVAHALKIAEQFLIKAGLRSALDEEWSLRKALETIYIAIKARSALISDRDFSATFLPRLQEACRAIAFENLGSRHTWMEPEFISIYQFAREAVSEVSFRSFLQEKMLMSNAHDIGEYLEKSSLNILRPGNVSFSLYNYDKETWSAGFQRGAELVLTPTVHEGHQSPCVAEALFDIQSEFSALYGALHTENSKRNCEVTVNILVETLGGEVTSYIRRIIPLWRIYDSFKIGVQRGRYRLKIWVDADESLPHRHFASTCIRDLMIVNTM